MYFVWVYQKWTSLCFISSNTYVFGRYFKLSQLNYGNFSEIYIALMPRKNTMQQPKIVSCLPAHFDYYVRWSHSIAKFNLQFLWLCSKYLNDFIIRFTFVCDASKFCCGRICDMFLSSHYFPGNNLLLQFRYQTPLHILSREIFTDQSLVHWLRFEKVVRESPQKYYVKMTTNFLCERICCFWD